MNSKLNPYHILAPLACTALLSAQELENIGREGTDLRVDYRVPPTILEVSQDGVNWTEAAVESNEERGRSYRVPIDDPTKLVRARTSIGGTSYASRPKALFPANSFPSPRLAKPERVRIEGNQLVMTFSPNLTAVREHPAFENGFPAMVGGCLFQFDRKPGTDTYKTEIPERYLTAQRQALRDALTRLRGLGDGTIPRFAGRHLIDHVPVPDPDLLPDDFDIYPFDHTLGLTPAPPLSLVPVSTLGSPAAVDPEKSLLVTDVQVVEDALRTYDPVTGAGDDRGAWTFGLLMEQMAGGTPPQEFVRRWLQHFETMQVENFELVPERRAAIRSEIIDPWVARNLSLSRPRFDLREAPFRLTAIVNRLDLRAGTMHPEGDAGEVRFVFCAVNLDTGAPLDFTVILEYGVPITNCIDLQSYARGWHELSSLSFGPVFNTRLQELTDLVTLRDADPSKPNGSAINQVRTNDFLRFPWDLREFALEPMETLGGTTWHLAQTTTKQTPQLGHDNTSLLEDYVTANEADILAGTHEVPLTFDSTPFLAGHAEVASSSFGWTVPKVSDEVRHQFSLATCSGCHGGETATNFLHVGFRLPGRPAPLSTFLTGGTITDPSGVARTFNDLARRAADLDFLAHMPCFVIATTPTITASH